MSNAFRELLCKIGSGKHTSENLTRAEAEAALRMILQQEATPAQIGAFLIAHRIKRPTGEELAGMLDAYDKLGPKLQALAPSQPVAVLGCPYDGHSRYAPITPLTALILAAAGVAVVQHGGERMPIKEGTPLIEIWQGLGINWHRLSLKQCQQVFEKTLVGFVYLPTHFPLAHKIVPYRSQIGKRPPLATLELIWSPYAGDAHIFSGFVHPPTENFFREAHALRGTRHFTTIKGLEGSCDLPRARTAIIGTCSLGNDGNPHFQRLLLPAYDYGFRGNDVPLSSTPELVEQIHGVLQGHPSELMKSAIWNGGFYLWRCGVCTDLKAGFAKAEALLSGGEAAGKLQEIKHLMASWDLEIGSQD